MTHFSLLCLLPWWNSCLCNNSIPDIIVWRVCMFFQLYMRNCVGRQSFPTVQRMLSWFDLCASCEWLVICSGCIPSSLFVTAWTMTVSLMILMRKNLRMELGTQEINCHWLLLYWTLTVNILNLEKTWFPPKKDGRLKNNNLAIFHSTIFFVFIITCLIGVQITFVDFKVIISYYYYIYRHIQGKEWTDSHRVPIGFPLWQLPQLFSLL